MNNKENEQSKMPDSETWIKLYYNVRRCKGLDWEEKALLTNYLSFQMRGDEFYQTDSSQGGRLGLSTAQVCKYTSRLKERGEIDTKMKYEANPTGGRPIPVRYVTVIDVDKWTKNEAIPVVKKIISAGKKRLVKKMAKLTAINESGNTKEIMVTTTIVECPKESPTSTIPTIASKDEAQPEKVLKSTENGLLIGFKKEMVMGRGDTKDGFNLRLNHFSNVAQLIHRINPNAEDFEKFAMNVLDSDVLDEKYLPVIWGKMETLEQAKVIRKKIYQKIEKFLI